METQDTNECPQWTALLLCMRQLLLVWFDILLLAVYGTMVVVGGLGLLAELCGVFLADNL